MYKLKTNCLSMRIPTDQEFDLLMDMTHEDDSLSHWGKMFSWVNDEENKYKFPASLRAVRGCHSARGWNYYRAANRRVNVGFRLAFDLEHGSLPPDIQDGEPVIIGTLFMDDAPVRVPQNPAYDGDITDYIPDAKLEMRPALDDPAYQVTAIKVADGVFVADRILLKNISYEDIEQSLAGANHCPAAPSDDTAYVPAGPVGFMLNRAKLEERGFHFDDTDNAYLYLAGLVEWLESHNKNYTKEQYHRIQSLKDIFDSIDYGV